jgi:hypothetical protein
VSLRAALISAYDSTMETFTLVVWFFWGSDMQVVRTVGLTQAECIAKRDEVLATGRRSATRRPSWYQPPLFWRSTCVR